MAVPLLSSLRESRHVKAMFDLFICKSSSNPAKLIRFFYLYVFTWFSPCFLSLERKHSLYKDSFFYVLESLEGFVFCFFSAKMQFLLLVYLLSPPLYYIVFFVVAFILSVYFSLFFLSNFFRCFCFPTTPKKMKYTFFSTTLKQTNAQTKNENFVIITTG